MVKPSITVRVGAILDELRLCADPSALAGMARYGISTERALGVHIPDLRRVARRLGRDPGLAAELWSSGFHEARILAGMVHDPQCITEREMNAWARRFDSWDVCDQCCNNLFVYSAHAWSAALRWALDPAEFVRRAGFVMMAVLAVHDKGAPDADFLRVLDAVRAGSDDPRNYVKKAVNWALRQTGKRNASLHRAAVRVSRDLASSDSRPARWIGTDALRELETPAVLARVGK